MKMKITNMRSLRDALNSIPDGLLDGTPHLIGSDGAKLESIEVTAEEFLVNKNDPNNFGYVSELKKRGVFDRDNFNVLDPIGTVLMYLK